jgi:hypothetical protein
VKFLSAVGIFLYGVGHVYSFTGGHFVDFDRHFDCSDAGFFQVAKRDLVSDHRGCN